MSNERSQCLGLGQHLVYAMWDLLLSKCDRTSSWARNVFWLPLNSFLCFSRPFPAPKPPVNRHCIDVCRPWSLLLALARTLNAFCYVQLNLKSSHLWNFVECSCSGQIILVSERRRLSIFKEPIWNTRKPTHRSLVEARLFSMYITLESRWVGKKLSKCVHFPKRFPHTSTRFLRHKQRQFRVDSLQEQFACYSAPEFLHKLQGPPLTGSW